MTNEPLVSSHFPYLPIVLELRQRREDLEALLDTGFDGDVVVPARVVGNGQPPDGHLLWTLADGSEVLAPAYVGAVRVAGMGPFPVVVTALGDEPIVGRNLTDNFTIILDHGKRLIIEP